MEKRRDKCIRRRVQMKRDWWRYRSGGNLVGHGEVCYNRTTSPKRRLNAKNLHRDQFLLAVRPFSAQNFKGKHKKKTFDHHVTNHEKPENILVSAKNYNNILHCNTFKTCALNSEYLVTSSSDMSGFALFFLPAYLNTDVRALRPKS